MSLDHHRRQQRTRTARTSRTRGRGRHRRAIALAATSVLLTVGAVPGAALAAPDERIDLRVLVLDDGGPGTEAMRAHLRSTGTPHTTVDLDAEDRPTLDAHFLSTTTDGRPHARYQGVVAPDEKLTELAAAERAALTDYRGAFDIPQVNTYVYPSPEVGLAWPQDPGHTGPLDGTKAELTAAGRSGPFGYLKGTVTFDDLDPEVFETYGSLAVPLPDQPEGAVYTSLLTAPIPGSDAKGSLIGTYERDGLRDLHLTFSANQHQQHFRQLATGLLDWLTDGVRLGQARNYFALHVDDVFAPDDRWDTEHHCTPGDVDCPDDPGQTPEPIRMTEADARHAVSWQRSNDFTMDLVYNAGSGERWREEHDGRDRLTDQLLADHDRFRWINHTYTHPYLGCEQDVSVVPWKCATDDRGNTKWVSQATITEEIQQNLDWARKRGLDVDDTELVTGQHSGLRSLPQQGEDNPNLAPALDATGVRSIASDNSRESDQRPVGGARTLPRHPMNLFYNVGTAAELVDEYNWIYTSAADGGSGVCETDPRSTCLPKPLDPKTGFEEYIAPMEVRTSLAHATGNDPRPHYIHQSNLAEERLAYPVMTQLLDTYRQLYAENTPLLSLPQRQLSEEIQRRDAWRTAVADGHITAYRIGDTVTVRADAAAGGLALPATAPNGTTVSGGDADGPLGEPYAGARSGWTTPARAGTPLTLTLGG